VTNLKSTDKDEEQQIKKKWNWVKAVEFDQFEWILKMVGKVVISKRRTGRK